MQFDSFEAFLQMGGYALYVWLSFGVSLVAMVWIVIDSMRTNKQLLRSVVMEQARQQRIAEAKANQSSNNDTQQVRK